MPQTPIELKWADAAGRLMAACESFALDRPLVIGIGGPVASGKSTLARELTTCIVATDDYFPDYDLVLGPDRDDPAFAHLGELGEHLDEMRAGRAVELPIWSFHEHKRTGTRQISPTEIIVCEGIHALHRTIRSRLDISVYVEAPASVRWSRWEAIEQAGDRGMGVEAARAHFDSVAEPVFQRFAAEFRAAADFVVVNPG